MSPENKKYQWKFPKRPGDTQTVKLFAYILTTSITFFQDSAASVLQSAASPPPKDALKVTLNFTRTLMKRLPEMVGVNPVKTALHIAKAMIEIEEVRPASSYIL